MVPADGGVTENLISTGLLVADEIGGVGVQVTTIGFDPAAEQPVVIGVI
jgi:hypothetical protein